MSLPVGTRVQNQTDPPSLTGVVIGGEDELPGFVYVQWSDHGIELEQVEDVTVLALRLPEESWCDCDYEPVRGIKAGRHLPSCRYGIVLDYLDVADPRADNNR